MKIAADLVQVLTGRKNSVGADQTLNLKKKRIEGREINQTEGAQKNPAWQEMCDLSFAGRFRPCQPLKKTRR